MQGGLEGRIEQVEGSNVTIGQQIKVAQDLIGRGGFVAPSRIQGHFEHEHKLSADDIIKIKERAASMKINGYAGSTTDAEIIESKLLEETNAEDSNT